MKKFRILALLMVTMLLVASATAETADPIVVSVGDKTVPLSKAQAYFDELYFQYGQYYESYGLALTPEDIAYIRDEAVDSLVMNAIIELKTEENNLAEITEEELAQMRIETDLYFDEVVASYAEYYGLSIEEVIEDLEVNNSMTKDILFEQTVGNLPYTRLYDMITADVTVSDEALQAEYDKYVASDKETYADDAATYEMYTNYYGSQIFYMPEGFRLIKHILLEIPAQITADLTDFETDIYSIETEITALNNELYALENVPEETETTDEETAALRTAEEIEADLAEKNEALDALNVEYEALRSQILPELKTMIDEIYQKLEAGETFEALIEAYGNDPGMALSADGYLVHKDSVIWDADFRDAAVALEKVGDISDPILTTFGVHIIQYAGDAESGAVPMSDEIRATITESLSQTAKDDAFSAKLDEWIAEYEVTTNPELIVLPQVAVEEQTAPEESAEPEDDAETVSDDKSIG